VWPFRRTGLGPVGQARPERSERELASCPPSPAPEPAQEAHFLQALAQAIVRRRLEVPAVFFLEMNRPLSFLAGQGVLASLPLLGLVTDPGTVERFARVLDSPENVERLITRIEELAGARDAAADQACPERSRGGSE